MCMTQGYGKPRPAGILRRQSKRAVLSTVSIDKAMCSNTAERVASAAVDPRGLFAEDVSNSDETIREPLDSQLTRMIVALFKKQTL